MPNLPIRNLGSVGVITDVDPFNLPLNGYTKAKNVRFDQGNVRRSPGFRSITNVTGFTPVFTYGLYNATGYDTVILVSDTFDVHEFSNGAISLDHATSSSTSTAQVVATSLANVQYLNRADVVPLYRTPSMSNFASLVNWDSTWRTAS